MSIYCLYFPNGKRYVGVEGATGRRMRAHLSEGGKQLVSRAIRKHGSENCYFEYLFVDLPPEEAFAIEIDLIREWNLCDPIFGYNLSSGGECGAAGTKWNEDRKRRYSDACKGRVFTRETRDKIAAKNRINALGRIISPEQRVKISATLTGRKIGPPSQETREKISKANTGRVRTDLARQRVSEAQSHRKKPVRAEWPAVGLVIHFESVHAAKRALGLDRSGISKVLRGDYKQTCGWSFQFADV